MKKIIFTIVTAMLLISLCVVSYAAEGENICLEKDVYCESEDEGVIASMEDNNFWSAAFLTDGDILEAWNTGDSGPIAWYGAVPTSSAPDCCINIEIDLDGKYEVTCVKLYPTVFLNGANMPADYTVALSENDTDWTVIGSETGLSGNHPFDQPFVYECEKTAAKFIRIQVTKVSSVADANYAYAGIAEIEAFGEKVFVPTAEPTEAPTEAPATEVPATEVPATEVPATKAPGKTEKKSNVLPIIIVAAAVIVAAVIAIIVISKKKKK